MTPNIAKCFGIALLMSILVVGCRMQWGDTRFLHGHGTNQYFCINREGKIISRESCGDPGPFSKGFAVGHDPQRENWVGIVDRQMRFVESERFYTTSDFDETFHGGLVALKCDTGLYGFVDTSGRYMIQPRFSSASAFSEGLAAVEYKSRYGYIDLKGQFRIPNTYDNADSFS
ncbi:MAG: WG repeat-containing protein [Armatimonadota bacterium]